jgi:hypothetical protein
MASTYTYDESETAARDKVRGLIGDVQGKDNTDIERVSDQVLDALLVLWATDPDAGVLRSAVEAARLRYAKVAGQKGNVERAPGLEPERRFERLRQIWLDLKAKLDGTDGSGGVPIMKPHDTFPCNVERARIGSLDEQA